MIAVPFALSAYVIQGLPGARPVGVTHAFGPTQAITNTTPMTTQHDIPQQIPFHFSNVVRVVSENGKNRTLSVR